MLIGELQSNEDRSLVTTGDVSERCHTADEARTKEWRNKEYHEISSETTMLQQEARLQQQNPIIIGV